MKNIIVTDQYGALIETTDIDDAVDNHKIRAIIRVFVINKNNELLLQKRSQNMRIAPGCWDQSAGGHVDEGETFDAAAKRELKEELGVIAPLEKVGEMYFEESYGEKHLKSYEHYYKCDYDGEINVEPHEVAEVQWISFHKLEKQVHESPESFTEFVKIIPEKFKGVFE
jgi:isopentenyl-diphosphate delta-isomerase